MKTLAHKFNSFESDIITVNDALSLKKMFPDEWESRDFYDIIKLRPMFPVDRKENSSSFTFRNSHGGGHGKGSKGITHELVQEYLCKRENYCFKIYGKEINLKIANSFDEWHVFDPTDKSRKPILIVAWSYLKTVSGTLSWGQGLVLKSQTLTKLVIGNGSY
jgi:hypothetical protein